MAERALSPRGSSTWAAARFTIGGVCLLAVRAFARRWLPIMALCLAGGTALSALGLLSLLMPTPVMTKVLAAPWPIYEIVLGLAPSIVAGPVIALALLAFAPHRRSGWHAAVEALRRLPATTAAAMCMQFLAFELAKFVPAAFQDHHPYVQLSIVFVLFSYQIAMFALGYLLVAVMVAESANPWRALKRAARLFGGRWIRVLIIALGLWVFSYAVDQFGTSMALSIVLDSFWWASLIAAVCAGVRLATLFVVFAATYHLLRIERDGLSPEHAAHDLAKVFD